MKKLPLIEIKDYPQEDGSITRVILKGDKSLATLEAINFIPKNKCV
jgi:hypothetical protein